MKRMLTGLQPSGELTLGSLIGGIKQSIKYQDEYESFIFVPDMHTITVPQDPEELKKTFGEVLIDTIEKFFPDYPADEAVEIYRSYQKGRFSDEIYAFDGMIELMKELKEKGYKVAVRPFFSSSALSEINSSFDSDEKTFTAISKVPPVSKKHLADFRISSLPSCFASFIISSMVKL